MRRRFVVRGLVQGVGFRPFVHAAATGLGARPGRCATSRAASSSRSRAPDGAVGEFARRLRAEPPPLAVVEELQVDELTPTGGTGFTIDGSRRSAGSRTPAAPDVATCDDCLRELPTRPTAGTGTRSSAAPTAGPGSRSSPTCPTTGRRPRWPASRCAPRAPREYTDPADRRFHAQPIACPACGPRLAFTGGRRVDRDRRTGRWPRRGPCWPRAVSSRSRAWAATTWPPSRPTSARSRPCGRASGAAAKPFA